jgi:hypothetical protein
MVMVMDTGWQWILTEIEPPKSTKGNMTSNRWGPKNGKNRYFRWLVVSDI